MHTNDNNYLETRETKKMHASCLWFGANTMLPCLGDTPYFILFYKVHTYINFKLKNLSDNLANIF